ncbi:nuclear transport factor 2 family protein [Streptomyces sp. WZ-12]|uniref:nuclear transport factor 2 family protein n=1 Tax=Streptomyces sp. WZ-12 TaxID=3030210 RepID=UPI0023812D11|nr:nuclear transport factor 2 family protein [Streptomyces sp. WZ-12]
MGNRTRDVVNELLKRIGEGDVPAVVELFADDADWEIPGDPEIVPWVGRRTVAGIPDFFRTMGELTDRELFDVERVVVDGPNAVLIGRARVVVRSTGKTIDTPFAVDIVVNPEGRISRYYMFEDSWGVAQAVRP